MDIPEGAIPVDSFEAAPHIDSNPMPAQPYMGSSGAPQGAIPVDEFESHEEHYGTTGQQIKAGLEGVAQGVAGPLAPMAERALGVKPEDIRGRAEENPITHGIGEGVGLVGGALTGTGEAAVMSKAGEAALHLAGLADVAKAATYGAKVGSAAVQQAAEMAVLQGSDEAAKMILKDPDTSAETAIANVGLAAALGGAGGAFITGAVSPLWKATAGPKVDALLSATKAYLNGGERLALNAEAETAAKTLGIEIDPAMRAGMSHDVKANEIYGTLRRAEKPEVLAQIDKLHNDISNSVMDSLGLKAEQISEHSENQAGHDLLETFKQEYKQKYEPIANRLEKRNLEATHIEVPDAERLDHYGKLVEKGMADNSVHSPYYKEYQNYANDILDANTIGKMDKIKTQINNRLRGMVGPQTDYNVVNALNEIKSSIHDFQEAQIGKASMKGLTPEAFTKSGEDIIAQRKAVNQDYSDFAKMSDELSNHLNIGGFRGAGSLQGKLTDKIAAEDLLKKFSIKGNSDFLPFLKKNFPDTLGKVIEHERMQLIKPAILSAAKKGENPVDVKKLSDIIQKTMAGKKEYIDAVLPKAALDRVEAGRVLSEAVPNPKNSGTPAGLAKLFAHVPASAMAAISMVLGHGPFGGAILGETAQRLGKDAPEAIKLAYLRFLGADQPVKAEGFKAMVDFIHATQKGESVLNKAISGVMKPGAQVLTDNLIPTPKDLAKLDKIVAKNQTDPHDFLEAQNGHVGHYLPTHQAALTQASATSLQYLQSLKPRAFRPGPLDAEIKPDAAQEARYNRALTIAQQPAIVLEHIKDGTLQVSDLKDLKTMYPGYYSRVANKLTNEIAGKINNEELIPYKTKVGLSLFLGQPLDVSMQPQSIIAAQPKPRPMPQPQGGPKKGSPSKLSKNSSKAYQTTSQAAEGDRGNRD